MANVRTRATPRGAATARAGQDERLARMCKALGHPARIRILRLLLQKQTCMCGDLVDALPLAQSTVSQHLKVLKEAGLVVGEIDGPRRCYCVSRDALESFRELTGTL
jgi:ArsR family transcriptional regulator